MVMRQHTIPALGRDGSQQPWPEWPRRAPRAAGQFRQHDLCDRCGDGDRSQTIPAAAHPSPSRWHEPRGKTRISLTDAASAMKVPAMFRAIRWCAPW